MRDHRSALRSATPTDLRLVLAGVAANAAVGPLFAWSLVSGAVARDLGLTRGGVAAVFAVSIAVMASGVLATGRALGRVGPRPLLLCAALAAGGGLVLAAGSHHPVVLWLGVAGLFGGANGVAYSVATTLASRASVGRRGIVTGLVVAAYAGTPALLGAVGPAVVAAHGWRASTAGLGVAAGGLLLLAALLAPASSPVTSATSRSAPLGTAPPGTLAWLWLLFAGATTPGLMVFAHAVPLATRQGLDATTAGLAVSVLAGSNLSGRVVAGWASDLVGRWPALSVAVAAPVLALPALVWGAGGVLIAGFAVLGFCYGATSALVPAATADLVGATAFPRAYARVFSGWGAAGLVGPVTGAGLLGLGAQAPPALLLTGLPLLPAGLALWVLSRPAGPYGSGRQRDAGEVGGGEHHL